MTEKILNIQFTQVKWLVFFSYFLALIIDTMGALGTLALPLPSITLLMLLIWTTLLQNKTHLFTALLLGLLSDSIFNSALGAHAIIFSLMVFLLLRIRIRFRSYPLWQQTFMMILYFFAVKLLGIFLLQPVFNETNSYIYWLSPLAITLLWPLLLALLKHQCLKVASAA